MPAADWVTPGWLTTLGLRRTRKACQERLNDIERKRAIAQADVDKAAETGKIVQAELKALSESHTRLTEQKEALDKLLGTASVGRAESPGKEPKWTGQLFSAAIAVALFGASCWIWSRLGPPAVVLLPDSRTQITVLAFAVALASYFSSVTREVRKAAKDRDHKATPQEEKRYWWDIVLIRGAEISVVVIGVLVVGRILAPIAPLSDAPLQWTPADADAGLLTYFGVVILYSAVLHARDWWFRD
jgi:hypothetical protein